MIGVSNNMILHYLCLLALVLVPRGQCLRLCGKYEGCGVIQSTYSILQDSEEVGSGTQSSGESSGESVIYDDFGLPATPEIDKDNVTTTKFELCACEGEAKCPLQDSVDNSTQLAVLDPYLTLAFCGPVVELFPKVCRGSRASWRVFGRMEVDAPYVDPATTTVMSNYTRTQVFCHCPANNYRRKVGIDTYNFGQEFAFGFICA